MTVVFVFWGSFNNGAERDAIKCAVARSGSKVIVISDAEVSIDGAEWLDINQFKWSKILFQQIKDRVGPYKWKAPTLARWLVLQEFVEKREVEWPIMNLDWDVLLFTDLKESYAPFTKFDYSISSYVDQKVERSAAYVVNNERALDAYCSVLHDRLCSAEPWGDDVQDMRVWSETQDKFGFDVGNLFKTIDGGVFDHNIAVGDKRFLTEADGYKMVVFMDQSPYFISLGGDLIKAHSTHMWGQFKTRTGAFARRAGIL